MDTEVFEGVCAEVHNAWWEEKKRQGFHAPVSCPQGSAPVAGKEEAKDAAFAKHCSFCHADMYPYQSLPEHVKEYDRAAVRAVLSALDKQGVSVFQ